MGRAPCCSRVGLHRGPWTVREDAILIKYIQVHGEGHWRSLPKKAGLLRCGKSCGLRWMNYLRPDIKRGNITPEEDDLIIRLHALLGNRWSLIAGRLPGRTDNEIKNYWNTHITKRLGATHGTQPEPDPSATPAKSCSKKRNRVDANLTTQKQKLHTPKPVRVTSSSLFPVSSSRDFVEWSASNSGCLLISHVEEEKGFGAEDVNEDPLPWSSPFNDGVSDVGFLLGDDQDAVTSSTELQWQTHAPMTSDNNLEKLYEEYRRLVKTQGDQVELDSFAESLLE